MNRFKPLSAFALLALATAAHAQVPANCQRISGEENPVAPDGYEADGTPIFCAKAAGGNEAPGYPPAAPNGYGQQGGYAPQAAPLASSGWNGRLNAPLPSSQKQSGYGGSSGAVGGSFQGRSGQGSGMTQSLGQSNRYGTGSQAGDGQQGYGQSGYGAGSDPYGDNTSGGSTGGYGSSPYGSNGTQGSYDPYADPYGTQPAVSTPPSESP